MVSNQGEFYDQLSDLPQSYGFGVDGSNQIIGQGKRGKAKGIRFTPVTAVAHRNGLGTYSSNKRDTLRAGKALGLTKTFTENLYQASTNHSNRGHSQVVRGRIRSALEI